MEKSVFEKKFKEAALRVAAMDDVDGKVQRDPTTIYMSLRAGLMNPESDAAFDALVMLADVVEGAT